MDNAPAGSPSVPVLSGKSATRERRLCPRGGAHAHRPSRWRIRRHLGGSRVSGDVKVRPRGTPTQPSLTLRISSPPFDRRSTARQRCPSMSRRPSPQAAQGARLRRPPGRGPQGGSRGSRADAGGLAGVVTEPPAHLPKTKPGTALWPAGSLPARFQVRQRSFLSLAPARLVPRRHHGAAVRGHR